MTKGRKKSVKDDPLGPSPPKAKKARKSSKTEPELEPEGNLTIAEPPVKVKGAKTAKKGKKGGKNAEKESNIEDPVKPLQMKFDSPPEKPPDRAPPMMSPGAFKKSFLPRFKMSLPAESKPNKKEDIYNFDEPDEEPNTSLSSGASSVKEQQVSFVVI